MIPFLDLGASYRELKSDIDAAVARVLESGWYIGGPEVTAFEEAWAGYCEAAYAVGVANGLDALTLALRALEIGPGDEVIVPSHTYIATWLAVTAVGATRAKDLIIRGGHNIDPALIEAAITPATRALLPVHLYGQPADMAPMLEIADRHGLKIVEDGVQCHGARYKGKRIGAHGDIVCWSFYPGKNLGALGDGGAITTDDADLAERVRVLGNYGSQQKYLNRVKGVNSRLDPVQAAILGAKLPYLDEWTARRQATAAAYTAQLKDCPLTLPHVPNWAEPVWHLYVIRSPERDELQKKLTAAGVGTLIHYPLPPHQQEAYADAGFAADAFPLAQSLATEVLSLPIGPQLESEKVDQVIEILKGVS